MGVWEKYFHRGLLWCVFGPGCPVTHNLVGFSGRLGPVGERHKAFRGRINMNSLTYPRCWLTRNLAPSWSWLGIKGTIRYIESYINGADIGDVMSECHLCREEPAQSGQLSRLSSFSGTDSYFLRAGMEWWSEDEWDRGEAEVMECIIV
jgi:hypothetical protein